MRFSFEHPDASLLFGKFERFLQNSTSTTTFRCFNKIDRMHFIKSSKGGTRVACKWVFWMKSTLVYVSSKFFCVIFSICLGLIFYFIFHSYKMISRICNLIQDIRWFDLQLTLWNSAVTILMHWMMPLKMF